MDADAMAPSTPHAADAQGPSPATDASQVFELEFTMTADDYVRFAEHLASAGAFHRTQMERVRRLSLVAIGVGIALLALLERDPFSTLLLSAPLAVIALVLWFAWPARYRALMARQARQLASADTGSMLGPKRYRIDSASVGFSGVHAGGYVLWSGVSRVTSDAEAIYLHVAETTAHVLPRRAFAAAEQAETFVSQAQDWQASAATTTAPAGPEPAPLG